MSKEIDDKVKTVARSVVALISNPKSAFKPDSERVMDELMKIWLLCGNPKEHTLSGYQAHNLRDALELIEKKGSFKKDDHRLPGLKKFFTDCIDKEDSAAVEVTLDPKDFPNLDFKFPGSEE